MDSHDRASVPTRWTRRLAIATGLCSIVFTIGTALHNFAVVDAELIETMMRDAGRADPAGDAPGFTTGFRVVGSIYIVGNALGILAFWRQPAWLFWVVLAVSATQAMGWFLIPSEMWSAVDDRYGTIGLLPSVVTDGGAVLLSIALIVSLVVFRGPWARRRDAAPAAPRIPTPVG